MQVSWWLNSHKQFIGHILDYIHYSMIIPWLSHSIPFFPILSHQKITFCSHKTHIQKSSPSSKNLRKKKSRHRQFFGGPSRGAPRMRCWRTGRTWQNLGFTWEIHGKSMGNSPFSIQNWWISHGFPRFFLAMVNLVGRKLISLGWCCLMSSRFER